MTLEFLLIAGLNLSLVSFGSRHRGDLLVTVDMSNSGSMDFLGRDNLSKTGSLMFAIEDEFALILGWKEYDEVLTNETHSMSRFRVQGLLFIDFHGEPLFWSMSLDTLLILGLKENSLSL